VVTLQQQCIEPLGQSKSDYDIFVLLAKRLGLYEAYTEGGMNEYDWVKRYFNNTDLPKYLSWADFKRKGYFVVPLPENYTATPALRWFAEGRKRDTPDWGPHPETQIESGVGLQTASGKIEFVSSSLNRFNPDDPERTVMPRYVPSWEGHHTSELYTKYPLQLISPHPRFSFHTMGDGKESWVNDIRDHRVPKEDGRSYWIIRLNTKDANARGIGDGDLVKAFNDRGEVILAARLTERLAPGTVHSYESCADYQPAGSPGKSADLSGCINLLTPKRFVTKDSCGMASNSCLIQVVRLEGGAP